MDRKIDQMKSVFIEKGRVGGEGFKNDAAAYEDMMKRLEATVNDLMKKNYKLVGVLLMPNASGLIVAATATLTRTVLVTQGENKKDVVLLT